MNAFVHRPAWQLKSTFPGAVWPAVPEPAGAVLLSLLFQFEQSQWLPAEGLRALQLRQLGALLTHAWETVPFYRRHWGTMPAAAAFTRIPPLTRRDLQQNFGSLASRRLAPGHGPVGESRTSGSTGAPVRILKAEVSELFWRALTLREHRWHRRDPALKLAAIRQGATAGIADSWGTATEGLVATGQSAALTPERSIDEQLQWLQQQRPAYLLTYPSLAAELARASLERGIRLPGLLEVRALGEQLDPETRALCRRAWDVPVTDMYSAQEVGYLALQCPEHEHYHVQSESVLLEVLDDGGAPCGPGEVGRVVVSDLHNFAMPLVRYDIGDYAEVGDPCPCGRGLPVLRRIVGRTRNMLVTRDGKRYWPMFGMRAASAFVPVIQHQFVQKEWDLIEARLVTASPLTAAQEDKLRALILTRMPEGFRVSFAYCDRIARSAGGKYEDFICEVSAAAR